MLCSALGTDLEFHAPTLDEWAGFLGDLSLQLTHPLGKWVDVEGWGQAPKSPLNVQEAMVQQVIIDIGDQDRESDPPPQLLNVGWRGRAVLAQGVDQFGIGMLAWIARFGAQHRGGRHIHQSATAGGTIKTPDKRDRRAVALDQSGLGRIEPVPKPPSIEGKIITVLAQPNSPQPFEGIRAQCRIRTVNLYQQLAALTRVSRISKSAAGYQLVS